MGKIYKIEVNFPDGVDLPDGFERLLAAAVDMVCKQWERQNPEMVMWPMGHGAKPLWREPEEPEFDSVYCIEVAAREDSSGQNPHNPNREALQEKARQERAERKAAKASNSFILKTRATYHLGAL